MKDLRMPARLSVLCALFAVAAASAAPVAEFSASAMSSAKGPHGVVLVSVNWNRRWKCGQYENAQLKSIAFDKQGTPKADDDADPDLLLESGFLSSLAPPRGFKNYAFIAEPGEYVLSSWEMKVAQSMGKVGSFKAARHDMIDHGTVKSGSFSVADGETVYIGHFFIDCAGNPVPWRFYPETADDFKAFLKSLKKEMPDLDVDHATFRLFQTTTFGNPFSLP